MKKVFAATIKPDSIHVAKRLLADIIESVPSYWHDKTEGMCLLNDSTLCIVNDDDFGTAWRSNKAVERPWLEIVLGETEQPFNLITVAQANRGIKKYRLEYLHDNRWCELPVTETDDKIKIHRFERVWGEKVRILIDEFDETPAIAEFGVYDERP